MILLRARSAALASLVLVAVAMPAFANSGGKVGLNANGCNQCHTGGTAPVVTLTPSKTELAPSEVITLTVTVTTPNGTAAGFNVSPSAGTLTNPGAGVEIASGEATHAMPKMEDGAGVVTFTVDWTAPAAPGSVGFTAWGNSVNSSGTTAGDRSTKATASVNVCATWHADQDGDGFGDPMAATVSCTQPANHVADASDCDDTDASVHVAATETCNLKDDDCDSVVDDGLTCEMDAGTDAGEQPDAGTQMDAGENPGADAGTGTDAGQNGGADGGTGGTGDDVGGCGCAHAPVQSVVALCAMVFVGLTLRRRRPTQP